MVSPEPAALLAAEELAELLGAEAAQALAQRPKPGRPKKSTPKSAPAAAPVTEKSPEWRALADLAGCVVRVSRPGHGEVQGRLSQRDGQWGLWLE